MKRYLVLLLALLSLSFYAVGETHFLGDRHINDYGSECSSCHNEDPPAVAVETEKCFDCHDSYKALGELTKSLNPNPHDSHIDEPNCNECHRAHRPPALLCDSCHQFDLNIR